MIASSIIPSLPCHTVDYIGQMAYSPSEPAEPATLARFEGTPVRARVAAELLPPLT
jgi:hypothetical protein